MPVRTTYDHLTPRVKRQKRLTKWSIVGIGILLLVAIVATLGLVHHATTTKDGATPGGQASTTPGLLPPAGVSVAGQVAPGLWAGTATVTRGYSGNEMGVPVGWNDTVDGAVAAAMNDQAHGMDSNALVDSSAGSLGERIYTKDGQRLAELDATQRAQLRKEWKLSATGQQLDDQGKPDTRYHYIAGGAPQYGAYQVLSVKNQPSGAPDEVELNSMVPIWVGKTDGHDTNSVKLYFRSVHFVMKWSAGAHGGPVDWRVQDTPSANSLTPSTKNVSNIGYSELVSLLGSGWCVPADSTEKAIPGMVFTR